MKVICSLLLLVFSSLQDTVDKNYLLGKFNPSADSHFVKIPSAYAKGSAVNAFLRKETLDAFIQMSEAARKEGFSLFIISATRNFDAQKKIWENKWSGKILVEGKDLTTVSDLKERTRLIMLYSSMPGTSRHHWGTDIDLNSLDNHYFEQGEGLKIYQWLTTHADQYGFCQPYTHKAGGRTGYEEEKWHWSYSPLSKYFLQTYQRLISYSDLSGFTGSEQAQPIGSIENYVMGVACP